MSTLHLEVNDAGGEVADLRRICDRLNLENATLHARLNAYYRANRDGKVMLEVQNGNERLRSALKVIRIWALLHDKPETRGSLVPSHVIELCDKALGREESK